MWVPYLLAFALIAISLAVTPRISSFSTRAGFFSELSGNTGLILLYLLGVIGAVKVLMGEWK